MLSQFSDSIVYSHIANEISETYAILESAYWLQSSLLLKAGLLCRGGATVGLACHTKEDLFGPAVNEAYMLESSAAIYPRIILHPKLYREIIEGQAEIREKELRNPKHLIVLDHDGFAFVDYFRRLDHTGVNDDQWTDYGTLLEETIIDGLRTSDVGVLGKFQWMREKFETANQSRRGLIKR